MGRTSAPSGVGVAADWSALAAQLSKSLRGAKVTDGEVTAWSRIWSVEWKRQKFEVTVYVHRSRDEVGSIINLGDLTPKRIGEEAREPDWVPELTLRQHNVMVNVAMPEADRAAEKVAPALRTAVREVASAVVGFLDAAVVDSLAARLPTLEVKAGELVVQLGAEATLGFNSSASSVEVRLPPGTQLVRRGKGEVVFRATGVGRSNLVLQGSDPVTLLTSPFVSVALRVGVKVSTAPLRMPVHALGPGRLELTPAPRCVLEDLGGGETSQVFLVDGGPLGRVLVELAGPRHSNAPAAMVMRPRLVLASSRGQVRPLQVADFRLVAGLGGLAGELAIDGADWELTTGPPMADAGSQLRDSGVSLE